MDIPTNPAPLHVRKTHVAFLMRKPAKSLDEFSQHWCQVHAPLYSGLSFYKRNVIIYEQIHRDSARVEELSSSVSVLPYDGVSMQSAETYERISMWRDEEAIPPLMADNEAFVGNWPVPMHLGTSYTFIDKADGPWGEVGINRARVLSFIRRKPGLSYDEFRRQWLHVHSKVILDLPIVQKNITRYEQFHVDHEKTAEVCAEVGGPVPDYDGIIVQEAESFEKLMEVWSDPMFGPTLRTDTDTFWDAKSVVIFPGKVASFR